MSAGIISQGDEILSGQVQDSNFPFLAQKLAKLGITVQAHLVLGDSAGRLTQAIKNLSASCQLVLVTGGLGPTADDITRYALSEALGSPLQMDQSALGQIEQYFARLKRPMSPVNRVQAMIPAAARSIENSWGTAPGIAAKLGQTHIFALPGVPHEMRAMFSDRIEPELRRLRLAESAIVSRSLHCCGAGES
ncbi:MAG: competence/damage-inducible protein A, partial [Phycisphaerae bacterium]|nr:competence/damage-inducible protein A [Phycisphaerae bacterium]